MRLGLDIRGKGKGREGVEVLIKRNKLGPANVSLYLPPKFIETTLTEILDKL